MDNEIMLITQKLKLKDIHPEAAKAIAKEHNIKEDDAVLIRKGLTPEEFELKEGERAVISYITTGAVDRDKEIVEPSGAILSDYLKHPVVLFGHDYKKLPIGKAEWIKVDHKGLIAKTVYAKHEEAEKVFQYRKDGFPLAESIGFVPLEYEDLNEAESKAFGGARRRYTKWVMLEYSDVAVPSNPEALQIAISKGLVEVPKPSVKELEIAEAQLTEKEGRVISTKNRKLIEQAIAALTALLPATESAQPKKEVFNCECLSCGTKAQSEEHCRDTKCAKCGGEMRRIERPGPGKSIEAEVIEELPDFEDVVEDVKEPESSLILKEVSEKLEDLIKNLT